MVTSKKYLLVSLVLGLSAAHGVHAASSSAGVGPRQDDSAAVGIFVPITPADLLQYSTRCITYTDSPDLEIPVKRQLGALDFRSSRVVSLATATELLNVIISPLAKLNELPFQPNSAIANVKAAYGALKGLLEYQIYLKDNEAAFQRGDKTAFKALDVRSLFVFSPSDVDGFTNQDPEGYTLEVEYAPLKDIMALFESWAEDSKKLVDILKGKQVHASLGSIGGQAAAAVGLSPETAAAASAAVSALVEGFSRGAERAVGVESSSLFNPAASVRGNVTALYKMVINLLSRSFPETIEHKGRLRAALMARLEDAEAAAAAADARAVAAQAAAAEAVTNASRYDDAMKSIQALLDAKTQQLAEIGRQLDAKEQERIDLNAALTAAVAREKAAGEKLTKAKAQIAALEAALAEAQASTGAVAAAASAGVAPVAGSGGPEGPGFDALFEAATRFQAEVTRLKEEKDLVEAQNLSLYAKVAELEDWVRWTGLTTARVASENASAAKTVLQNARREEESQRTIIELQGRVLELQKQVEALQATPKAKS